MKKTLLFLLFVLSLSYKINAQELNSELQENVNQFHEKINELIDTHTKNGFTIIREDKLPLRSDHDMIINLQLVKGNWYHFAFVGDPSSRRIKMMLSNDQYGDFINDKVIIARDKEFWSEFSYQCYLSGNYYLTIYQKSNLDNPLSYILLFKKVNAGINMEKE